MSFHDRKIVASIVIGAIVIALLLICGLSVDGYMPTKVTKSDWLSFWSTYLTGVSALVIGYLAISYANKNSEKALKQQTVLLIRQDNDKIKAQISDIVNRQYRQINVLNHCSTFVALDLDDIPGMLQRLADDRAQLHDLCNEWCLFYRLHLQHPEITELVNRYQGCWAEASSLLDEYLKLQIDYLKKVSIVEQAEKTIGLYNKIILALNQKSHLPGENPSNTPDIAEQLQGRDKQQKIVEDTNYNIKDILTQVLLVQDSLLKAQDNMQNASTTFLSNIRSIAFYKI